MSKDEMLLYGRNSVLERVKANPATIRKIFLQDSFNVPRIKKIIRAKNVAVEHLSSKELARIKHSKDLQGIVAKVDKFNYACFDDLLDQKLTLIFLDRINDPQNLGVIIRTAACFGKFAVVIPKFDACAVTEAVLHVASGGENFVPVSMVTNLAQAIITAKKQGYWMLGGIVADQAQYINEISLPFPLGLILGSEGEGIRYGVQKQLDIKARIPMKGANLSFNVAIACAIFCHEISKQKETSG